MKPQTSLQLVQIAIIASDVSQHLKNCFCVFIKYPIHSAVFQAKVSSCAALECKFSFSI